MEKIDTRRNWERRVREREKERERERERDRCKEEKEGERVREGLVLFFVFFCDV